MALDGFLLRERNDRSSGECVVRSDCEYVQADLPL